MLHVMARGPFPLTTRAAGARIAGGRRGERSAAMPTYVVLYHFTDQGAKNIKGTVQRANEARADNERRGFKVQGLYWTQGRYDLVAIVDAPDEQAMLAGLFNIAGAGNVRSETLRAFSADDMQAVLQKM
jgi:uncharacterized protein with GYD domain